MWPRLITDEVLKIDRSIDSKSVHPENIDSILVTKAVLKSVKSISFNSLHPLNKFSMFTTLDESNKVKSIDFIYNILWSKLESKKLCKLVVSSFKYISIFFPLLMLKDWFGSILSELIAKNSILFLLSIPQAKPFLYSTFILKYIIIKFVESNFLVFTL